MNIRPLGGRVLIKPEPQEEETKGGILIADSAKTPVCKATVLAISKDVPLTVKEGDTVVYNRQNVIEIDRERFLIHEDSILAIL